VSPARAGAFNANFAPDTLEAFRKHCKDNGKQYTKVLEKLAEIYLRTDGAILTAEDAITAINASSGSSASRDTQDLLQRILKVEQEIENGYSHLEALLEDLSARVGDLEK
jgi:hypothetical protein